jgi:hypothetical protein
LLHIWTFISLWGPSCQVKLIINYIYVCIYIYMYLCSAGDWSWGVSLARINLYYILFSGTLSFFYCFIIHMCIQHLGHFSPMPPPPPLPPTPPPPSSPYPLNTQQKLFCPYL